MFSWEAGEESIGLFGDLLGNGMVEEELLMEVEILFAMDNMLVGSGLLEVSGAASFTNAPLWRIISFENDGKW
jgi:hypothetical protein